MKLDVTGLRCPLPITALSRAVKPLHPGGLVLLRTDDPDFRGDLCEWCRETGHCLVSAEQQQETLIVLIRKAA